MLNSKQTPLEEMAERVAEGAGLAVAARAVGTLDHHKMLKDHRLRLREGHKAMAKAAGCDDVTEDDPTEGGQGEEGSVGDRILVTGDVYGSEAVTALQAAAVDARREAEPPAAAKPPAKKGFLKTVAPYVIGAAVPLAGIAGWAAKGPTSSPPASEVVDTDTAIGVDIETFLPGEGGG